MKLFEKVRINTGKTREREIRFLGLPLCQYGKRIENGKSERYFEVLSKSFEHKFLDKIIEQFNDKYDFAVLFRASGIGEAYCLSFLIKEMISNAKSKRPCIVVHKPVIENVCRLLMPNIPVIITDNLSYCDYNKYIKTPFNKYKGIKFECFHMILDDAIQFVKNSAQGNNNKSYLSEINKYHKCREIDRTADLHFSEEDKDVANFTKGLNLDKFVIFIPEASFFSSPSEEFWQNLANHFRAKGYDIFINKASSEQLTVSQVIYLASLSKGIIAARCGLVELCMRFDIPKHIIYMDIEHNFSGDAYISFYSLRHYPDVNLETVFEYYAEKYSNEKLIQEIIKNF